MTVWILYDEVTNTNGDFIIRVFSTKEKALAYMITHLRYEDYPTEKKEDLINEILTNDFEGIAIFEKEIM